MNLFLTTLLSVERNVDDVCTRVFQRFNLPKSQVLRMRLRKFSGLLKKGVPCFESRGRTESYIKSLLPVP
jgi:hypothetical protein